MVDIASDGFPNPSEDLGLPDVFRLQTELLQMRLVVHVDAFIPGKQGPANGMAILVLLWPRSLNCSLK